MLHPRRSLTHPLWLAALATLVLNDHLLKGSGLVPGWLTGKLSDFVGMLVAPALLACLLAVRTRRALALCHVATGAVFTAIKLSATAAGLFIAATKLTPFPWSIVVDPSDLVALPMLLLSYRVLGEAMARAEVRTLRETAAAGAAVVAGMAACMGTSPPNCEGDDCTPAPGVPFESASLTIGNTTAQQRLVRVRPLREGIAVDCATLLEDPSTALSRSLFAPAEAWLLEPGRALPLRPRLNLGCEAYLVDAQGLDMTLIAWSATEFPLQTLSTSVSEPSDRMIMMREADGQLALDAHPAVFEPPALEDPQPEPICAVPDDTIGIAWSDLPFGLNTLLGIESSPDGCHDLELTTGSFYVCLPLPSLPFAVGGPLSVQSAVITGGYPESGGVQPVADGIEISDGITTIRAIRGNVVARPSNDGANSEIDYLVEVETLPQCEPHHDECGSYVTPLRLSLLGGEVPEIGFAGAGESVPVSNDGDELYIVRAQRMPIRDTACSAQTPDYYETVLVLSNVEQ